MVATISSIAAGQCANFLPYTSVLNAPAAQRGAVPCDSAAARIRILSQATNASACSFNGVNDWVEQDGKEVSPKKAGEWVADEKKFDCHVELKKDLKAGKYKLVVEVDGKKDSWDVEVK